MSYYDVKSIIYGNSGTIASFIEDNSVELEMVLADADFRLSSVGNNHVISLMAEDIAWDDTMPICGAWNVLLENAQLEGLKYQRVMKDLVNDSVTEVTCPESYLAIGFRNDDIIKIP